VRLNVGGIKFETTVATLSKHADTYFSAAFSGRHAVDLDAEGCYFIDRDGTHFNAILNFLRTGRLRVPSSSDEASALMDEVEYYMLTGPVEEAMGSKPRGARAPEYTRKEVWILRQRGVTYFRGCIFSGLDLSYVGFQGCDLQGADFRGCDLSYADLSDSNLCRANLDGAIVKDIDLCNCTVSPGGPKGVREATCIWRRCDEQRLDAIGHETGPKPGSLVQGRGIQRGDGSFKEFPLWLSHYDSVDL